MKILSLGSFTFSTDIDTNLNKPISNTCTYKIVVEYRFRSRSKKIDEAILQAKSLENRHLFIVYIISDSLLLKDDNFLVHVAK